MIAITALVGAVALAADRPLANGIYGNPTTGHFVVMAQKERRKGVRDILLMDGQGTVLRKFEARKGEWLSGLDQFDRPVLVPATVQVFLGPKGREEAWARVRDTVVGDVEFTVNDQVLAYRGRIRGYFETRGYHGYAPLPDRPEIVFTSSSDSSILSVASGFGPRDFLVPPKSTRAKIRTVPLVFEGRPVGLSGTSLVTAGLHGGRAALFLPEGDFPKAALASLPLNRTRPLYEGEVLARECLAVVSLSTGRVRPIAVFEVPFNPMALSIPGTVGAFAVSGNAIFTVRDNKLLRTELPRPSDDLAGREGVLSRLHR